jgi:hypothetical protein
MRRQYLWGALAVLTILQATAGAVPVVPSYDAFGPLPAATFGGSGIPNHAVAISSVVNAGSTITLGLTAHQRFVGPNLVNNGAGDFFASPGISTPPNAATWNFAFYTDIVGGGTFNDYRFELSYDLDAAAGNDLSTHGTINLNAAVAAAGGALALTTNVQDSQNLGFAYLTTGIPTVVTAPIPPVVFSANSTGEYTFQLRVYDSLSGGTLLDAASIRVNVAVPEASAAMLLGSLSGVAGCATLGWRRLRRRS